MIWGYPYFWKTPNPPTKALFPRRGVGNGGGGVALIPMHRVGRIRTLKRFLGIGKCQPVFTVNEGAQTKEHPKNTPKNPYTFSHLGKNHQKKICG